MATNPSKVAFTPCIGLETEFGIHVASLDANPPSVTTAQAATRVIKAAAQLSDAWSINRSQRHLWLPNGARLYEDIGTHIEYATAETRSARDAVRWDAAGAVLLAAAAQIASDDLGVAISLFKNNTDNKGETYGTHENHLVPRHVPWPQLVKALVPFLVSRIVYTGAGRVGHGLRPNNTDFQLSQRADFMQDTSNVGTTRDRPIVNARDEPHSDSAKWRRLHLIVGDANLCQVANLLKVSTLQFVLRLLSEGRLEEAPPLAEPVRFHRTLSRDETCQTIGSLADGTRVSALDIQRWYFDRAYEAAEEWSEDSYDRDLLERWGNVLDQLERDPDGLMGQLDWVTKRALLRAIQNAEGREVEDWMLRAIDLRYHDIGASGLYSRLLRRDRVERVVSDSDIEAAVSNAPNDSRAWFRGQCIRHFGDELSLVDWAKLAFGPKRMVKIDDPTRFTEADIGDIFVDVVDVAHLRGRLLEYT